jgi:N-methylhydantoinase B
MRTAGALFLLFRRASATKREGNGMVDKFLMIVLRRRFEAIIREMVSALFKSGRSGVLNTAMDFSCSVTDAKFQSISAAIGLPVHTGAIDLIPRVVAQRYGDTIAEGDCYANNDGYLGNTHCADFTLCAPVFFGGKLRFYTISRAHFADMGFPTPTTYGAKAFDRYQEGIQIPCVKIQEGYKDVREVLDICKANIRAPEQFFGDYVACLGAVRTGERRLIELCEKYGAQVVAEFLDEFQNYAEDMTAAAIAKLPKARVSGTAYYDSELPQYPEGLPIKATIDIDPQRKVIDIDLTENIDNVPLGVNLTESTTLASCRMATLNILGPDVPRCTGAFRRINVKMREGAAIGKPKFPAATSAATSNLCSAFAAHLHALYSQLSAEYGSAYGAVGIPASLSVISGRDPRKGGREFVNQLMMGYWGGPGVPGADGWLTYGSASSQGVIWQSSVEVVERQHPIIIERLAIRVDSGGAGEFQGGPGASIVFYAHLSPVRFVWNAASRQHPPPGVRGGKAGAPTLTWKETKDGTRTLLGTNDDEWLQPGERLYSDSCGGGGYGEPRKREKGKIEHDLREGWITHEYAKENYGVVL